MKTKDQELRQPRYWSLTPDLLVVAHESPALCSAMDTVFGSMATDACPTPGTLLDLRLEARAGGRALLIVDDARIMTLAARDHLPPLLEPLFVGLAVRTYQACVALHGACVVLNGKGVLLTGEKGSGKSVLAAHLSRHGEYLGDEVAFISPKGRWISPFAKAATIKEGAFPLFEEADTYLDPLRGPIRYFQPPTAVRHSDSNHSVDMVLVPVFDPEATTPALERASPEPLALGLVQQCFDGLERGPDTLRLVADLVSLPSYIIRFARCDDVIPVILELVA